MEPPRDGNDGRPLVGAGPARRPDADGGRGGHRPAYDGKAFERLPTPGLGKQTVYGVWGTSADDFYAVGSAAGRDGFVWH